MVMYLELALYTNPQRPHINPRLDLFAYLHQPDEAGLIFPARLVDTVTLTLPPRFRTDDIDKNTWEYIVWQVEEKGYTMVRHIDKNWWYWAMLVDKNKLVKIIRSML
jgi:hypothetical protein